MKETPAFYRQEWKNGMIVMILSMFFLPILVKNLAGDLLTAAQMNFLVYFITAAASVYVLRAFLLENLTEARERGVRTVYYAAIGYLGVMALNTLTAVVTEIVAAGYINRNDQVVSAMARSEIQIVGVMVVVLAPIVEECLYRGLLFRGVYDRSPAAAWVLSVSLFSVSHIVSFLGVYTPLELLVSFIQYLPAGIVLCITYQRTGTIIGPMLTHAIINLMALYATMR